MSSTTLCRLLCLYCFAVAAPAVANNVTISGAFDGTEATMASDTESCDGAARRFLVAGSFQVSASGTYTVVDAGNDFPYYGTDAGVADVVVLVYEDSFNSASPTINRIRFADDAALVDLAPGTTYVLVVQHWCDEIVGPYAVVIEGPGNVTGAGFPSLAYTLGEFTQGSPTANFSGIGLSRYVASAATMVPRSGNYYFGDISPYVEGVPINLHVYQGSFNPDSPEANLVASTDFAINTAVSLQSGVNYIFVAIDVYDAISRWQFVLFPPGPFNFNPGMNGAWVADGVEAQGIFMEVFPSVGILFFAHFTFTDQVAVAQADKDRITTQSDGDGGTRPQNHVGAPEQIWLTAYGNIPEGENFMNLKYENSTGGAFNAEMPQATTDTNYGTGWIEAFGCNHVLINWTLPGGVVDTRDYQRLLLDGLPYCESFIKAAPISPPA
jgi:hypothetical protein